MACTEDCGRLADQASTTTVLVDDERETHPRACEGWSLDEDATLRFLFRQGWPVRRLAETHGRRPGGIESRLVRLGLIST